MSISHLYCFLFPSLHFFHLLWQASWLRLFPSDTVKSCSMMGSKYLEYNSNIKTENNTE